MIRCYLLVVAACAAVAPAAPAADGPLIASMDELRFQAPKAKAGVELVTGKVGKAVRFTFDKAPSTFCTSNLRGTPAWDQAAGFSFWVKGDGRDQLAGLEFIYDDDYAVRYDLAFPVKGADWTKVTVAWADLVPVLPGPKARPLGTPGGNRPSKLSALWFGRWWYWGDYPGLSFAVDEIRLEPTVERDAADYKPDGPPLRRVLEKLKAGKPVTVVTMGDSLTDYRHWANRTVAWPKLLRDSVREKYKSEVMVVNPAIGGTQLRQNVVLLPRWLEQAPAPDLVTLAFGANDWEAGMRGEEFRRSCADAVDRVRRATRGKADVLLLTTVPGAERWETTAELAAAGRQAAHDRNAGLADTQQAFHAAGKADRGRLFVSDKVHLGPPGHALVAETVLKAIEAGGR
jgi:lysophospholipase L1-like esterase